MIAKMKSAEADALNVMDIRPGMDMGNNMLNKIKSGGH